MSVKEGLLHLKLGIFDGGRLCTRMIRIQIDEWLVWTLLRARIKGCIQQRIAEGVVTSEGWKASLNSLVRLRNLLYSKEVDCEIGSFLQA